MVLHSLDLLVVLMAFSDDGDHVAFLGVVDRGEDRLPSVRDHDVLSVCLRETHLDILDDILVLLKTRVVGCNDAEICHLSANLTHGISAILRTVSAAAEYADEALRMIISQCREQTLHADRVVGVIHDHAALFRYIGDLHAAVHPDIFEGAEDRLFCILIKLPASAGKRQRAHCQGCQGVIRVEFTRHSHTDSSVNRSVDGKFDAYEIMV